MAQGRIYVLIVISRLHLSGQSEIFTILLSWIKYSFSVGILIILGISPAIGGNSTVAVIKSDSVLPYGDVLAGFKAGLQQKNIHADFVTVDYRKDPQRLHAQIANIQPSIILCLGTKALEQAAEIKDIPKIFSLVTSGNAQMWSRRGDIYGVTLDLAPTAQFRIIRQIFPEIKNIGVLYNPRQNQKIIEEAKKSAAAMSLSLKGFPVVTIKEIPTALEKAEKNIDLIWAIYDQTVYSPESAGYILMQALRKRIPLIGFSPYFAKAGAPLALYGDYQDMGQQAALQAMAALNGEKSIIRIVSPRKVRIAINEKVGRFMGITFTTQFMKTVHQFY